MPNRTDPIDELLLHALRAEVEAALREIGERHGIDVRLGPISYTPNNAQMTVEAARIGAGGVALGRDAEEFLARAAEFGLNPTDLGREFGSGQARVRIVGLKPRRKAPVICESIGSKRLLALPVRAVRAGLADADRSTRPGPEADAAIQAAVLRLVHGGRHQADA